MALTDPQKFKEHTETEVEAARVSSGDFKSVYQSPDGNAKLSVSTSSTNNQRLRHLVRIDVRKLATNVYEESKKQDVGASVYLVVDRPENGFTVSECKKLVAGLVGLLSASSYALTEKVLGGQS
jgi:hypothetical protein